MKKFHERKKLNHMKTNEHIKLHFYQPLMRRLEKFILICIFHGCMRVHMHTVQRQRTHLLFSV